MSTIPTGEKSPGTRDNTFACMIRLDGIISVNSAYSYSYGLRTSEMIMLNVILAKKDMYFLMYGCLQKIPTAIKTPSTVMVLGAYVKKRRDIY